MVKYSKVNVELTDTQQKSKEMMFEFCKGTGKVLWII